MRIIKTLTGKVKKFVRKNGGTLPKLYVWIYASIFLWCGLATIFGVVYEFFAKGLLNYKAVNELIREYFAPSIAGTFAIVGVLMIDRNQDGIPDRWEEEVEEKDKGDSK